MYVALIRWFDIQKPLFEITLKSLLPRVFWQIGALFKEKREICSLSEWTIYGVCEKQVRKPHFKNVVKFFLLLK